MKALKALLLMCVLALLTISIVFFAFSYAHRLPEGTRTVPYLFHVAENPGVDAGTDIFRLGAVTQGGSARRSFTVEQEKDSPAVVTTLVRGQGAEWLSVKPSVVAVPGVVEIELVAPLDAPMGTYRGEILVVPGNHSVNN